MKVFFLVLMPVIVSSASAYNILTIFHFPARSSFVTFKPFLKELAERGHNLTVISHFSQKEAVPNYHEIVLDSSQFSDSTVVNSVSSLEANKFYLTYLCPALLSGLTHKQCDIFFSNKAVQELYRSNIKFDVVMLNIFQSECIYGFAQMFKSPVIMIHSAAIVPWAADRFALPMNPAVVPNIFLTFTTNMSFFERVENSIVSWSHNLYYDYMMFPMDKEIVKDHLGETVSASLKDLIYNTSLFMVNTHFTLNLPRLTLPNVIEVGGIHITKPRTLPKVCKFLYDYFTC